MSDCLRLEVAHLGVDVGTTHPTWIDTDMVREGDAEIPAFARLQAAFRFPFSKTYPVDQAAAQIVDGIARRSRRVCVPGFVRIGHVLRPLLATRLFERDLRLAAPGIAADFRRSVAERGIAGASVSGRVNEQQLSSAPVPAQPAARSRAEA